MFQTWLATVLQMRAGRREGGMDGGRGECTVEYILRDHMGGS